MNNSPYAFGQTVYCAFATSYGRKEIPCPICAGKGELTLILGDGAHERIGCEACELGYDRPQRTMTIHEPQSSVEEAIVTGLELGSDGEWLIKTSSLNYGEPFATREEAEARRIVLHAEAEAYAKKQFEENIRDKKKHYTWSVSYHRECLKRLQQEARYHEEKLRLGPTIIEEKA